MPGLLVPPVTLLDVPVTILWALGVDVPRTYEGRPLFESIRHVTTAAVAA